MRPHYSINPIVFLQSERRGGWMGGKQQQHKMEKNLCRPFLSKQRFRNHSCPLQSGRHVEKDFRLGTSQLMQPLVRTVTPQPPSHICLSRQAPEIPSCWPAVSSCLSGVYFTGELLRASELVEWEKSAWVICSREPCK